MKLNFSPIDQKYHLRADANTWFVFEASNFDEAIKIARGLLAEFRRGIA